MRPHPNNLFRLITWKPQAKGDGWYKFDSIIRHPSLYSYVFSATLMAAWFSMMSPNLPASMQKNSNYVNYRVNKEAYKEEHGHYPH